MSHVYAGHGTSEREDGASVDVAMTEARFMSD